MARRSTRSLLLCGATLVLLGLGVLGARRGGDARPTAPPPLSGGGSAAGGSAAGSAYKGTITIRADYWPPYNGKPGSAEPGFMIEVATRVFADAGYRVDYQTMPWVRAIEMTRAGAFDAIVGAFKTDVPDFVFPEVSMAVADTIFVVRRGNPWRYDGIASLARVKIGVVKDYSYGDLMDGYVRAHAGDASKLEVIYGEDVASRNLHKLARGRIDATVEVRAVLDHTIARERLIGQFEDAGTISRDDVHIAFSPKRVSSAGYAALLARGVSELRASGELARITARYGYGTLAR